MNYIKQLQSENESLKAKIQSIENHLSEIQGYYSLPKFHGIENDFAHVSTDIQFRLNELKEQFKNYE